MRQAKTWTLWWRETSEDVPADNSVRRQFPRPASLSNRYRTPHLSHLDQVPHAKPGFLSIESEIRINIPAGCTGGLTNTLVELGNTVAGRQIESGMAHLHNRKISGVRRSGGADKDSCKGDAGDWNENEYLES